MYLRHKFHSMVADGADATLVRPSNWNDDHDLWLGHRSVTAAGDTITHDDHLSLIEYNNAGGVNVSIAPPNPPTAMPLGWFVRLRNIGMGVVILTGTGGANVNGQATLEIAPGDTVDIHSRGTADYVGVGLSAQQAQVSKVGGGGVLRFVSGTQLSYLPFRGGDIIVNGQVVPILPGLGIVGLTNTSCFVEGVPNQSLAQNTFYRVYAFDNAGTLTADFSVVGHETSNTPGNVGTEIKIGDDSRSLIGIIYAESGTAQFIDDRFRRYVRSWFNDPGIHLQRWFTASRATMSGIPVSLNPEILIAWINFADELITLTYTGGVWAPNATRIYTNIAVDGVAHMEGSFNSPVTYADSRVLHVLVRVNHRPTEGIHMADIFGASTTGAANWWVFSNDPSNRPTLEGLIGPRY
ncbi:MAG: hypothetical protein C5B54_07290 [Acidobacteria bacterium]|nr:MAG: hypothetical protein C5B54_07290 [Acidobacteriota bacterium]